MNLPEAMSAEYIDAMYQDWRRDPNSVPRDWQFFFAGFQMAGQTESGPAAEARDQRGQAKVEALVHRYRDLGHLMACLDPLEECPWEHPLLEPSAVGLTDDDFDRSFVNPLDPDGGQATLGDVVQALKETYCGSIGVEYMHLQDPDERAWLRRQMEPTRNRPGLEPETQIQVLDQLTRAARFENFLSKKYMAQTRFSLEGGESLIPLIDQLIRRSADQGVVEVVFGTAHRGRLNILVNLLGRPVEDIFLEFMQSYDPDCLVGSGDVKYHNGYMSTVDVDGRRVTLVMAYNPSHLETVDPVAEGMVRGRQDGLEDRPASEVMPLLIHGDAAFAGQGLVAEVLNMSQLSGYQTAGTIHLVINNQIGYTTLPEHARSSRYSTDAAKMLMAPIFHVHAEDLDAVVHVCRMAADYRMRYGKDVVVDLICYRRYGHNEGDEPYFTQPAMYDRIKNRTPVDQMYRRELIDAGVVDEKDAQHAIDEFDRTLDAAYQRAQDNPRECPLPVFYPAWDYYHGRFSFDPVDTSVQADRLKDLARKINAPPKGFHLNQKLGRLLQQRLDAVEKGQGINWANAEALAFASLVTDGRPIRLSGEDSGRGTFSQRHAQFIDAQTEEIHVPFNHLGDDRADFTVVNSPLTESGVMGFEYGYALARPDKLVLWEAQFGDFSNNAQVIIDLYIVSGEEKWQRPCGVTLLLPHGWEGLGPEHSSARLERFLQLCANDNIIVANPSTPAQYFHLLRRQVLAPWRKPLIVMTPKSLLRNPAAVSDLDDLAGGGFQPVLDDPAGPSKPTRILFCSGKIYYDLAARRDEIQADHTAIVRVEQFYPFPKRQLEEVVQRYKQAQEYIWVQEGPANMEGWGFMRPRLEEMTGQDIGYVGRPASSSPATGFANIYKQQQQGIIARAVGPAPDQG